MRDDSTDGACQKRVSSSIFLLEPIGAATL